MDEKLLDAYRGTSFRARTPEGTILLTVGLVSPELDGFLERQDATDWAFVTAWNPGSRSLPDAANRARQRALISRLGALGLATFPGEGVGADGDWPPEESVLVLGIDRETARRIGESFGQNAIVVGVAGAPAELLICEKGKAR